MRDSASFCSLTCYEVGTVIVGSGASGLNAHDCLVRGGYTDVLLISDSLQGGTSRNAGSDKQTYYKLSLSGSDADSVRNLAEDLFAGGCVDGDIALCEAANSVSGFLKLVQLGVPFPVNRYGEFIGYKTDHDPYRRATSAGPYTSRFMTEALEKSVDLMGGKKRDATQVVRILVEENIVKGVLCLDIVSEELFIIWCQYLILATGAPAVMYHDSVYPTNQFGATGLAFEAGCLGRNLTEWQYGLASVSPRWNVSGTYMQALPRIFSVDINGEENEFLESWFNDFYDMLGMIFLKGYQWPFDVRKIREGSSLIDLAVYLEQQKGNKVYLDYRSNPHDIEIQFEKLPKESYHYLHAGQATFGLPIDRLRQLNEPAYQFYLDHGVDLAQKPLEIAVCAQHNNGGIAVDLWSRTSVNGLFAIGEAAATHGVYRPGGSALNAGQVGSLRVAKYIIEITRNKTWASEPCCKKQILEILSLLNNNFKSHKSDENYLNQFQEKMSLSASLVRNPATLRDYRITIQEFLDGFSKLTPTNFSSRSQYFRFRDCLIAQLVYVFSMETYSSEQGKSRGSALYLRNDGEEIHPNLPDSYRTLFDHGSFDARIQEISYNNGRVTTTLRQPNPIPESDDFFENVWRVYRENRNVY